MSPRAPHASLLCVLIVTTAVGCPSSRDLPPDTADAARVQELGLTQLATAPAVKRVWAFPEETWTIRISPDGRLVTHTDYSIAWRGIILHDVLRGTERPLTKPAERLLNAGFTEHPAFSPDGHSIAYVWSSEDYSRTEVRISELAGPDSGRTRTVLAAPPDMNFVEVSAWTPDGSEVLATWWQTVGGKANVVAVQTGGGGMRNVRTLDWPGPENMAVSPDGRWIASDQWSRDMTARRVHVMGIDGEGDRAVTTIRGDAFLLGWTGTGQLLVSSQHGGAPAVWGLTLEDGRAIGAPVLVRSQLWGMGPVGGSHAGVFYSVRGGKRELYTAPIDSATGAIGPSATTINAGEQVPQYAAFGWSADGEYLAYAVERRGYSHMNGPVDVIIRSISRGNVRRLSPDLWEIHNVRWFHDGHALLLYAFDFAGRLGLFRLDLENASLTPPPLSGFPRRWGNPVFSRDGKRVFSASPYPDSNEVRVEAMDAVSGTVSLLRRITDVGPRAVLSLSPDGERVALLATDHLGAVRSVIVAPIAAGPARTVYRTLPSERISLGGLAWTPDGQHLILGMSEVRRPSLPPRSEVTELRRLSLANGTLTSTGFKQAGLTRFEVSPDGRTLVYGVDRVLTELWKMEPPVFGSVRPLGEH